MAKSVLIQAQMCMDSFFQSFRPENAFYELEDFARYLIDERDNELEREFLVQYQQNKNKFPIINPQWSKTISIDVKYEKESNRAYAEVCEALVEFPFDTLGMGIQAVAPTNFGCGEFVRIANNQIWSLCLTATTDMIFYSTQGCQITLHNFFGCTDKLQVRIVPSQAALPLESQTLPDGKAAQIREVVLSKMFRDMQMKLGKISMHNDQNANVNPNESSEIYAGLKTK